MQSAKAICINSFLTKIRSGLFRRTLVYVFSYFLSSLIGFLLLPILTKYLSPYDYGIIETFLVLIALLTGILGWGGNTLLAKEYFKLDCEQQIKYISNILGVILVIFLFTLCAFFIFGPFFPNIIKLSKTLLFVALFVSFADMIITILLVLFQLEKKTFLYALFCNSKVLLDLFLSIFFILVVGLKWEGRIIGITFSSLVFLFVSFLILKKRKIKFCFSFEHIKRILCIGFPLALSHMSGWTNNMIDKLMINNLIGLESTGLYALGYRFGMIVMMLEVSFSRAWLPFFYENINKNRHKNNIKIVKVTYIYLIGLIIFSLLYGFFSKHFLFFMVDQKFYVAGQFIFLISLAYCFDGIQRMFSGYLIYQGKTKTFSGIIFFIAVFNVVANYILLRKIGLIGAAWATFLSFLIGAIITIVISIRSHRMPWGLKKVF